MASRAKACLPRRKEKIKGGAFGCVNIRWDLPATKSEEPNGDAIRSSGAVTTKEMDESKSMFAQLLEA